MNFYYDEIWILSKIYIDCTIHKMEFSTYETTIYVRKKCIYLLYTCVRSHFLPKNPSRTIRFRRASGFISWIISIVLFIDFWQRNVFWRGSWRWCCVFLVRVIVICFRRNILSKRPLSNASFTPGAVQWIWPALPTKTSH